MILTTLLKALQVGLNNMKKIYAKLILVVSTVANLSFAGPGYERDFSSELLMLVNKKFSQSIQSDEELSAFLDDLTNDDLEGIAKSLDVDYQDVLGNGSPNMEGAIQ